MEYPKPFPFPGTASEYPAQREGCGPLTDSVSRPGDSGDAATELTDLVGRLVVSLLRQGRGEVRVLGWAWLVTAAVIMTLSPRIYYLFAAYPILFAAGSVAWERWLSALRGQWIKL